MERFTLVHSNSTESLVSESPYRMVTNAKVSTEYMGADELQMTIISDSVIGFKYGDVVNVNGRPYELHEYPDVTYKGDGMYEYNVTMHGIMYDMSRRLFRNCDYHGQGSLFNFSLTYTLQEMAQVVVNNANSIYSSPTGVNPDMYENVYTENENNIVESEAGEDVLVAVNRDNLRWILKMDIPDWSDDMKLESKTMSFANESILSALQSICNEWGCEWWVEYVQGQRFLHVGIMSETIQAPNGIGYFGYGPHRGFNSIKQTAGGNKRIASRMYVSGGSQNILASYRDYVGKLQLPNDRNRVTERAHTLKDGTTYPVGTQMSLIDANGESCLVNTMSLSNSGIYETYKEYSDVFPSLTLSVKRLYLNQSDIDISTGTRDTELIVNYDPIIRPINENELQEKFRYPELYFDVEDDSTSQYSMLFDLNACWYQNFEDLGLNETQAKYNYWCYINGIKNTMPNGENEYYSAMEAYNSWASTQRQPSIDNWFKTEPTASATYTHYYSFHKLVSDKGNTAFLMSGQSAQIVFTTGKLAGVTFDVSQFKIYTKNGITHRRFCINRVEDDTQTLLPSKDNSAFRIAVGDKFKLINICFPLSVMRRAEEDLYFRALEDFNLESSVRKSYSVGVDSIFIRQAYNGKNPFKVGRKIPVMFPQFGGDGVQYVRVRKTTEDVLNKGVVTIEIEDKIKQPSWYTEMRVEQRNAQNNVKALSNLNNGEIVNANGVSYKRSGRKQGSNSIADFTYSGIFQLHDETSNMHDVTEAMRTDFMSLGCVLNDKGIEWDFPYESEGGVCYQPVEIPQLKAIPSNE